MFRNFSQDSFYAWFRLLVTLLIGTSLNIGMWAIVIVLPKIQNEFNFTRAEVSILVAFTMLGFALGNFFLGKLVDRHGIVFTLIFSAIMVLLGFFVSAKTDLFFVLGFCHVLIGFGTAAGFGPLMSDISFWFSRNRGIAVAIAASGNYISGIIWPSLVAFAFEMPVNWRSQYIVFGIIAGSLSIPLAILLRKKIDEKFIRKDAQEAAQNLSGKLISPRILIFILVLAHS